MSHGPSPTAPTRSYRRIGAPDAADLILRHRRGVLPALALFDIRDRSSFEAGHVPGAEHLAESGIGAALRRLSRSAPVLIYCYHGNASRLFAQAFADLGFGEVYSVDGGFAALSRVVAD